MAQSTPPELLNEMIRMYNEGLSIRNIGAETGKSFGYVHKALAGHVTFRSRGGARKRSTAATAAQ